MALASSPETDVFRNSKRIARVANTGTYVDKLSRRARVSLAYRVCAAGTSTCSASVTVQVVASAADVVLLDWDGCASDAGDSVLLARRLRPELAVIALSARPEARQHALVSGATAFVSKGDPPERVLEAVRVHTRGIDG